MSGPLLSVQGLKTWLRSPQGVVRAVDGVDFELHAGKTLGIVGESGSGKSVLARSLMGLNPSAIEIREAGHVWFEGRDLRTLDEARMRPLRGRRIAMVFQDPMTCLNPVIPVGEQIARPLMLHLGLTRKAAHARALELLASVGILVSGTRTTRYPHQLSGGQRQRVMIALALSCDPDILIADEPTTALDVTVQRQVLDLLMQAQQARSMAILLITHNLGVVSDVADDIAVMYAGSFVEKGPARSVLDNPRMRYTQALLECAPSLDTPVRGLLPSIPGRPPPLTALPEGCRFAPRCRFADAQCGQRPPLAGGVHSYACWHPVAAKETDHG